MKILVAVKRVVDHAVRVRVKPDGSGVETANVRMSMNPFDKHSVEAAVRLAEAGLAEEIVAVSIGPRQANDVILTALAMGAHRGILVEADMPLETLTIAKLLKRIAEEEKPDLILLGKQAVDDDSGHVPQMLAGLLDWPQATFASTIEVIDGGLEVTREVDYGRATFALPLPAIVSADLRLNEPRNAALPMVMKARSKPLVVRPMAELGVDAHPRLSVEKVSPPAERPVGQRLASADELIALLQSQRTELEGR